MSGSFLGPRFGDADVRSFVAERAIPARQYEPAALAKHVASLLAEEKVVGLLQGRMEFGPRALGGRSIVGDPRSPRMQSMMNLKIKFRDVLAQHRGCERAERFAELDLHDRGSETRVRAGYRRRVSSV